jgi:hypothetical protein
MIRSKPAGLVILIIIVIIIIVFATSFSPGSLDDEGGAAEEEIPPLDVTWEPVYAFNKEGYEPSIACDSSGALYYTAHKNLDDKSSWDYLASWFFISTDDGKTWDSPTEPFPTGLKWQTYLGDEGDIAVDARDYVYFVDTYLLDNHLHVWRNQGEWAYSERIQKSAGLDDRPWVAAQGDAVVHYLGNNAVEVAGGRYWYYRSINGGRTWETKGDPVPGNGWAHVDAERYGDHAYVISESEVGREADILMYISDDEGATWNWNSPVTIGHRNGSGRQYPIVSSAPNGLVWALWNDATDANEKGNTVFVGRSKDYGRTWDTWNITPFQGFMDYPTINAGPDGSVAVAFYATTNLPVNPESEWYLYGAMQLDAAEGNLSLNFSIADPTPCYVGDNTHALHDFFEIVITPDKALNIGYQYYIGPENGHSDMYFVRGTIEEEQTVDSDGLE